MIMYPEELNTLPDSIFGSYSCGNFKILNIGKDKGEFV